MTWTSFREKNVPPAGAIFGYADQPGMTVGCVNPALPGSRDWVRLDSYWFARSTLPVPGGREQAIGEVLALLAGGDGAAGLSARDEGPVVPLADGSQTGAGHD